MKREMKALGDRFNKQYGLTLDLLHEERIGLQQPLMVRGRSEDAVWREEPQSDFSPRKVVREMKSKKKKKGSTM